MTNTLVWRICRFLIDIGRRGAVPSPDIAELLHYATCPECVKVLGRQGCFIFLRRDGNRVVGVTFASKELHDRILHSLIGEGEEEGGEDLKPRRLVVWQERPERPKDEFYV